MTSPVCNADSRTCRLPQDGQFNLCEPGILKVYEGLRLDAIETTSSRAL